MNVCVCVCVEAKKNEGSNQKCNLPIFFNSRHLQRPTVDQVFGRSSKTGATVNHQLINTVKAIYLEDVIFRGRR